MESITSYLELTKKIKAEDFNSSVGDELRKLREFVGLSQAKLAKKLGRCRNTIVLTERGERKSYIPIKQIIAILRALELSMTLEEFLRECRFPKF